MVSSGAAISRLSARPRVHCRTHHHPLSTRDPQRTLCPCVYVLRRHWLPSQSAQRQPVPFHRQWRQLEFPRVGARHVLVQPVRAPVSLVSPFTTAKRTEWRVCYRYTSSHRYVYRPLQRECLSAGNGRRWPFQHQDQPIQRRPELASKTIRRPSSHPGGLSGYLRRNSFTRGNPWAVELKRSPSDAVVYGCRYRSKRFW